MNESPAGRDGYIFARGRKLYHLYKQTFPMEFWYGLTPNDNREDAVNVIDVRTLPAKYLTKPVTVEWTKIPRRSMAKALREQAASHALAFANALFDGYSLEDHARREREKFEAEWAAERAKVEAEAAERTAAGLCPSCGKAPATSKWGECEDCAEVPF